MRKSVRFYDVCMEWLEVKKSSIKLSSYQTYERIVHKHFLSSELSDKAVQALRRRDIAEFCTKKLENLSPGSVNYILTILLSILKFSGEQYGFDPPKITYVKKSKQSIRVLSVAEQQILEQYLHKDITVYKLGVIIALYTGIRLGELCALTWDDVTLTYISVTKTMRRLYDGHTTVIKITDPKTETSIRKVPLPAFLSEILEEHRQSGYVLKNRKGEAVEPRLMQIVFKKIIDECGLDKTNFHALRHTFATRCVEAGFDIKSLSEILGHSDVKTTLNRYVHSSFEQKQKNMQLLTPVIRL